MPRLSVKQPFSDPEQLERVTISRKLVELKRDVVVPPLEELVVGEWNLPGLLQLFTRCFWVDISTELGSNSVRSNLLQRQRVLVSLNVCRSLLLNRFRQLNEVNF